AANFDDAALARTDTAEAQFLEKRLAVAAASEGRVGEPQQVRDGALDFVESALRAESIAAVVLPIGVVHASDEMHSQSTVASRIRRPTLECQDAESDGRRSEGGEADDLVRQREVALRERPFLARRDEPQDDLRDHPGGG